MMAEALISIIMPAFNAQKHIAESIESVIAQTYPNWELIVIDDGSTDMTASIIKKYVESDPRIKYFYQQNGRQGKAKNLGIQKSEGCYIAFLDSDDLWLKEKLEVSLNEITSGEFTLLFTDCYIFDDGAGYDPATFKVMGVGAAVYEGRPALLTFLTYNKIPNLTVLVKKEAMLQAGDFTDLVVAEEYEMWLRLLKNGAVFKAITKPLSMYRVHSQSITASDRTATFEVIEIIKAFGKKHPDYAADTNRIVREKIKYWLYHGGNRTAKKFRIIIKGVFALPLAMLFYGLSFIMPVDQLRKIVARLY